jgi:outer membrane biosynthesis protein TonB
VNRNIWLTIALVCGAAAIWWAMLWEPAAQDAEEPVAEAPVAEPAPAPAAVPTPPSPTPSAEAPAAPPANAPSADPPASPTQQAAPAPEEQIPAPERTGPVDALKAAFASEPRDSKAVEPETAIQAAFRRPDANGLLKSVLCRSSVCKVETRWTPARAAGFMGAFMNLVASPDGTPSHQFDHEIAISPEGAADTNSERAIDVYLKRVDSAH